MTAAVEKLNEEVKVGAGVVATEEKVEKPKKEKKISMTNVITASPEGTVDKFSGKSKVIAELLLAGNSKSEVLQELSDREKTEGPLEGKKPITHQAIYQVYKRLISIEGVILGEKELVRAKVETAGKVETVVAEGSEAVATASDELAEATEEEGIPEEDEEVTEA
jgi:hypothetical protein